MLLWEILVPTQDNDGKPFRTRHHKEWDSRVRRISNGLTIFKPANGQWIDRATGTLYLDRNIPVRIACSKLQIIEIMKMTAQHYKQLDVMVIKISDEVLFLSDLKV